MIIDEIIEKILAVDACDREGLVLSVFRDGLCGHINNNELMNMLVTDYKSEVKDFLTSQSDTEIMDEYCETYGFEYLVDELASRREEGEEDE